MSSPLVLMVALLKASPAVGALVADRIEPEVAHGPDYPRIVVRQAGNRPVRSLKGSVALREARVNLLCAGKTFTAADRLAATVISALKDIRHARVAGQRITVLQDGDDTGSYDEASDSFTRIVGFRVSISGG